MSAARQSMPRKRRPQQRGIFKCGVFFIDHRLPTAFYMHSTALQDRKGVSLNRFKRLITDSPKFKGKVNNARIYENGSPIYQFTAERGTWERLPL